MRIEGIPNNLKPSTEMLLNGKGNEHSSQKNFELGEPKASEAVSIGEKVQLEVIEKANKALEGGERIFEFSIHEKTHQIMVKVIDGESKEIIREIPPEKLLDMVALFCEMAGIFVDERV